MIFDARALANMWLSVAIASGDEAVPAANAVVVEFFEDRHHTGARLSAINGTSMLFGWVPARDAEPGPGPDPDELPTAGTVIVIDDELRVRDLMSHLRKVTRGQDEGKTDPRDVSLTVAAFTDGTQPTLDPSLAAKWCIVEIPGQERLVARTYDGDPPPALRLWLQHSPEPTDLLAVGVNGVLRLGKLSTLWGGTPLVLDFAGRLGAVAVQLTPPGTRTVIRGLAMPCRHPDLDPDNDETASGGDPFTAALDALDGATLTIPDRDGGDDTTATVTVIRGRRTPDPDPFEEWGTEP